MLSSYLNRLDHLRRKLLGSFYDRFVCTPQAFQRQVGRAGREGRPAATRFSVAIPIHNRGKFVYRPLFNLIRHPAVTDIVIYDDCSEASDFDVLKGSVDRLSGKKKISLYRHSKNQKALVTKRDAVARCESDWVLVLDSDNTAFCNYLDALGALSQPDKNIFYCSSYAFPFFPFDALGGGLIDFARAQALTADSRLRRYYLINDGNYMVHRDTFARLGEVIGKPLTDQADVMLVNYGFLSNGGGVQMLPNTSYYHRLDATGRWVSNPDASKQRAMRIFARLEAGLRWDEAFSCKLRDGR